jgi:hypothetical protein
MALNTDSNDTRTYNFTTALAVTRANSPTEATNSFPSETGNVFDAISKHSIAYFFLADYWNNVYDFTYKLTSAGSWSYFFQNQVFATGIWIHPIDVNDLAAANYNGAIIEGAGSTQVVIAQWTRGT